MLVMGPCHQLMIMEFYKKLLVASDEAKRLET
jgi:hypothetical protein